MTAHRDATASTEPALRRPNTIELGRLDQARRGWLERADVPNMRPLDELRQLILRG